MELESSVTRGTSKTVGKENTRFQWIRESFAGINQLLRESVYNARRVEIEVDLPRFQVSETAVKLAAGGLTAVAGIGFMAVSGGNIAGFITTNFSVDTVGWVSGGIVGAIMTFSGVGIAFGE